jgi:biotin operon repressor
MLLKKALRLAWSWFTLSIRKATYNHRGCKGEGRCGFPTRRSKSEEGCRQSSPGRSQLSACQKVRRGIPFTPSKSDLKILSLRKKGLWLSEIAQVVGMQSRSVEHRIRRLKESGFSIPKPTSPRPNAHRKVTDEKLLAPLLGRDSRSEIAAKVGIATQNVHKKIKRLQERG